jgi:hypothetical protein
MSAKKPPVMTGEDAKKLRIFYSRAIEVRALLGMVSQRFQKLSSEDVLIPRVSLLVRFLTENPDFNLTAPSFAKTFQRMNAINPQLTPGDFAVMLGLDAKSAQRLLVDNKMRPVTANFLKLIDQQLYRCNNKREEKAFYKAFHKNFIDEMNAREITVEVEKFLPSGDWFRLSKAEGTGRRKRADKD